MHIIKIRAGLPSVQRTESFTGTVWGDPLSAPGSDPTANAVTFAPRARTYWHRHAGGQLIIGRGGLGLVVADDGTICVLGEGESVWTPPGQGHWHGGGPESLLSHAAYSFGRTAWLHEVSEDEYAAAVARAFGDDGA